MCSLLPMGSFISDYIMCFFPFIAVFVTVAVFPAKKAVGRWFPRKRA